ncbi:hypothetical protein M2447_001292 [Ereboglobus sp. PH5-10]|uniref:hypothetical protein n=1 Tax=Ereboglobus sp. PH5-10 TaxID=2940629 RepID=UPI00240550B5|nr:hypothetical protein [Ereboglobus sp. PH5-10]MDF9827203.1 hypothetical protein [Ereboglobus sp. PH5-10]
MKTSAINPTTRRAFLKKGVAASLLFAMPAVFLKGQGAAIADGGVFMTGRSEKAPRPMYKVLDIPEPAIGKNNVQSVGFYGEKYYVFHHGSIVQEFAGGAFKREYKIKNGRLFHPNDACFHNDQLWICDTGDTDEPPSIKRVDIATMSVVETLIINKPGWRTASVAFESDTVLYCCQVEAIDKTTRKRFLVRKYDRAAKKVLQEWYFPLDQYYVQGCALDGKHLYVTTNNGARPCSKFRKLNLAQSMVEEVVVFDTFGESEGLQVLRIGGRLNILTAKKGGVYRIVME